MFMAHPMDPSNQPGSTPSTSSYTPPPTPPSDEDAGAGANTAVPAASVPPDPQSNLPIPHIAPTIVTPPLHANPPFNTHQFFVALEKSFPGPIAANLMRVSRALLVDRIGRVRRDALTVKDLESQAYLFKAALSELRTETSLLTRNETAAMRTATSSLRREVDALNGRMKEDVATLKHEIQMEVDSRKNESKNDLKKLDIEIEELLNKSFVNLGELRTSIEESRWENMRKSVAALTGFLFLIVISMELFVSKPKKSANPSAPPPKAEVLPPGAGGAALGYIASVLHPC
ncbi:Uncharacterized protein C27B12.07 [Grifola frondosa]|uniref:Uncharacterized protein C27B12.07 n=1 Tax=Grifola frondosa TaxID=5627 RepID=A0A1C7MHB8_GRIFR|nr:Uncharacterized protein C27B12.07 [Grifola frondosa]